MAEQVSWRHCLTSIRGGSSGLWMKSISNMSLRVPSRLNAHWSDSAITMMIDELPVYLTCRKNLLKRHKLVNCKQWVPSTTLFYSDNLEKKGNITCHAHEHNILMPRWWHTWGFHNKMNLDLLHSLRIEWYTHQWPQAHVSLTQLLWKPGVPITVRTASLNVTDFKDSEIFWVYKQIHTNHYSCTWPYTAIKWQLCMVGGWPVYGYRSICLPLSVSMATV